MAHHHENVGASCPDTHKMNLGSVKSSYYVPVLQIHSELTHSRGGLFYILETFSMCILTSGWDSLNSFNLHIRCYIFLL